MAITKRADKGSTLTHNELDGNFTHLEKKFTITNSGSGAYVFSGGGTSSDSNPTLYLQRGETYTFAVNATGHPFYIKTVSGTGTGNAYNDGTSNNGVEVGDIEFTVQHDAPDILYYNCSAHSSMAGTIHVVKANYSIDDLSDVDTTTTAPTSGQVLKWDGSKWAPAVDNSGSGSSNTFSNIAVGGDTVGADSTTDTVTFVAGSNMTITANTTSDTITFASSGGGGGAASITSSNTAPNSPSAGDLWWYTTDGELYFYYDDGDSQQWIQVTTPGPQGPTGSVSVTTANTTPSNPSDGELWWNTNTNKLYIYYVDTDSSQWVQATTPGTAGTNGTDGATPGRNKFINGNFDVWQRGTSFTATGYTADRWKLNVSGSSSTLTQQEFTLGQTDVPNNPKYYLRLVNTTNSGAGDFVYFEQRIEDVRTFQGETVTVSFWAKADAAKTIHVEPYQNYGTGGSPSTAVAGADQSVTLSTSWTKYTVNLSVASITGKTLGSDNNDYLSILFWMDAGSNLGDRVATGNQSGTFEFSQIQIESGSSATDFEQKTLDETYSDCLRYFQKGNTGEGGTRNRHYSSIGSAICFGGTISFKSYMRAQPTITLSSHTLYGTATSVGLQYNSGIGFAIKIGTSGAGTYYTDGGTYDADAEL